MSKTVPEVNMEYPNEGVIRSAAIADTVAPTNSMELAVNMNFDSVGAMQSRPGVSQYASSSLSGKINALGSLGILSPLTRKIFAQVYNGDIFMWDGSVWTNVRTMTVGLTNKVRFTQWLNLIFMCNGYNGTYVNASSGGAFSTTGVPSGFPLVDFINGGFDGRLWGAVAADDTLWYSDVVQFNNSGSPKYSLTFNTANYIGLSPQDGESITGLFRVPRALLVFKQNSIYRVFSATNVDPYPAYNVGTYSQESIVKAKDGVYFHHSSGFYKFNYDGQPTEISRRVIDFVRAIPRVNYEKVLGIFDGFDAIKWHVGAVTVDGISFTNCVMRYTISTQVWTIYDYPTIDISSMLKFDSGTAIAQLAGTADGKLCLLDSGYDDLGAKIYIDAMSRWKSFSEMYVKSKSVSGVGVTSLRAGGLEFQYQTNLDSSNEWMDMFKLTEKFSTLSPNASTDDFNTFRYRIKGFISGAQALVYGVELQSIQIKGFDEN